MKVKNELYTILRFFPKKKQFLLLLKIFSLTFSKILKLEEIILGTHKIIVYYSKKETNKHF